jgi:hypothetical protein
MPFSAATGLIEAASAKGTAISDQTQARSIQAFAAVRQTRASRLARILNASLEPSKDMKILSVAHTRAATYRSATMEPDRTIP